MNHEPEPSSEDVVTSERQWASKRAAQEERVGEGRPKAPATPAPRTEERLSFLLRESNHRVRNILATISALVRHTASAATSIEEFERALQSRLNALVELHDTLGRDEPRDLNVREMVAMALGSQAPSPDRYEVLGENPTVPASIVAPLFMALHELAVNALKHGALSTPGGRVFVEVEMHGSDETLQISWRERGGPPAERPEYVGFGISVIERGLEYETGGRSRLVFTREGVEARLTVPLPRPSTGL